MSRRHVIYAALALVLIVGGAIVSATQDDRFKDGASEAVVPSPTETLVAIQDCPYGEASCILGQGIERALSRGNVDAVMDFGAPHFYVCPGPGRSDTPSPLCDRVSADEGRVGYPLRQRGGELSIVEPEAIRATLVAFVEAAQPAEQDEAGDGAIRLYAFSCSHPAAPAQNLSCAREGIIVSAIVRREDEARREILVFWAQGGFQGRTLPFNELWVGDVAASEMAVLFETGGRLEDLGEVDVIDQSLPR